MNKGLLIGGLVLVVISIIVAPTMYLDYETKELKQIVVVKLIELPNCENGYKNKFVKFEYNGSKITKRTSCKYVDNLYVGQNIEMFHKDGTNNFIFKNEDVLTELVSLVFIGIMGIVITIMAIRKKR